MGNAAEKTEKDFKPDVTFQDDGRMIKDSKSYLFAQGDDPATRKLGDPIEALKNYLFVMENEGHLVLYRKVPPSLQGQLDDLDPVQSYKSDPAIRESYLSNVSGNVLFVDRDGRSVPYDLRAIPNIVDLTGWERYRDAKSHNLNYIFSDLPGLEGRQGEAVIKIRMAADQIHQGIFVVPVAMGHRSGIGMFDASPTIKTEEVLRPQAETFKKP